MARYILRRCLAGIPIVFGVLLVTFLLFHAGAGDPAALMAGKNAGPRELEDLRVSLRLDRPLFYGHWRRTEIYPQYSFSKSPGAGELPDAAEWVGTPGKRGGYLRLCPGAALRLKRQWEPNPSERVRLVLRYRGGVEVAETTLPNVARWTRRAVPVPEAAAGLMVTADSPGAELRAVRAERYQANAFDSQFVATLRQVVDVRRGDDGAWKVVFLDFGQTLLTREPIRKVLLDGLGPSLALTLPIFFIELVLGVGIALASAYWRDRWPDRVLMVASVGGLSISYLVYILVGQYVFGYWLNWFPVWGYTSWRNLVLPVTVGVASGLGGSVRFYRTVFLNELYREHVRTAVAKGCSVPRVLVRHVLPNALIPIITRAAVVLPFLYTGSLLLESFFGIPGLGYAGLTALANADLPLLKALVLVGSVLFVLANIAADIGYALADPRVRLR